MDDKKLVPPTRNSNGTFENPFSSFQGLPTGGKLCRFLKERIMGRFPDSALPNKAEIEKNLPMCKPDLEKLNHPPDDKIQYMWIGHATVLYQSCGWNVLSDPIWSERCSPISFLGPKRYRPPPLSIDELPRIDVVVISHNHYDHLDLHSVNELNARFGKSLHWIVPEGLKSWFVARSCETVTELCWWQNQRLVDSPGSEKMRQPLDVTCTPAQHWSLRTGCDRNQSLWSSWAMKTCRHSLWFSGDTGYCEAFEVIGQKFGPFDVSAIGIGAYCPRYFMSSQHVDPEHAYQIHKDLNSKLSFGIHWGTFPMGSTEPYLEPRELIMSLQEGQDSPTFITVDHGAVNSVS